ncbi:MAG: hypothetical protein HY528_02915 [Chloroflexi bacterium]|nr:hypothetical protein [Chloroflexota bacterium]
MRKTREFENILDECLERLLVRGETIEQCLQHFPKLANELKPLLETALAVNQASAIQPNSEFRDRARYQFYSALQETGLKRKRPFFLWRLRWAAVMSIVLALLVASGGTVMAASGSMPDEFLYPTKLVTEQAQLLLTPSALGKAELYTRLADKRVDEIARMAGKNKPEKIEQTAQLLNKYLTKIAALTSAKGVKVGITVAPSPGETTATEKTTALAAAQALQEATAAEKTSAAETPKINEQAKSSLARSIMSDRRAKLKETMGRYASNHPARLRALLETAPPATRQALLDAIAKSEGSYKKAIESLGGD